MVGPFVFVDQFGPARLAAGEGMDVRPHPHINLATVTWLFEGAIDHRDSLGSFSTIRPGTVNLMTAGSGIVHSERSPQSERDGGAGDVRHADLARAARRARGDRPGVRGGERPAADRGHLRQRAGDHGQAVGQARADHLLCRDDLRRDRPRPGGRDPDRRRGRRARGDAGRRRGEPRWPAARALRARRAQARRGDDAVVRRAAARSCCSAARPSPPTATSTGTSSARAASGSSRPRRTGRPAASRSSPATTEEFIPLPDKPKTVSYP